MCMVYSKCKFSIREKIFGYPKFYKNKVILEGVTQKILYSYKEEGAY